MSDPRPRRPARITRRTALVNASRIVVVATIFIGWEVFAGEPSETWTLIDVFYVSQPSDIFRSITDWWGDDWLLLRSIQMTLHETIVGFAIGAALGGVAGFVLGVNRFLADVFKPVVVGLNSIPRLALVPLFILWFGLGIESKLALVVTTVFFLVFYATYEGARDVDQQQVDVLRVMGGSRWQIYRIVTIPSAMTWIVAGLRMSVPYALVAAVTAEMLASNRGMGYLIVYSSGQFDTAGVFGGIVVLVVLGLALSGLLTLLEKRLLRWKPDKLMAREG